MIKDKYQIYDFNFEFESMSMKIGSDEFCLYCMEWQEFDEEGKCKGCGKPIVKKELKGKKDSYAEYEKETIEFDESEEL